MSEGEHPTEETLRRFAAGTASRDEGQRVVAHLLRGGCGSCNARVSSSLRPPIPADAYTSLMTRLENLPLHPPGSSARPDGKARALLAELDGLPVLRQEVLVRNSQRFLSPQLARLLCERSFALRYQNPGPTLRAARLAVAIAERLPAAAPDEAAVIADLRADCASQLCNARRISGDLREAEQAMAAARAALREGTGDPALRAVVNERLGALRRGQGHLEEAISAYEQAVEIWRDLGRPHELARVLVGQAVALRAAGDLEGALELLLEAMPRIEGENDPHLTLAACHAVVSCQIEAGRIEDATLKWIELRFLYEQVGDPLLRLRERWLEGELLIAQGQARAGIHLLEAARRAYEKHNMRYDAAVIGLEIAHGHLRLGHRAQVRRLLAEVLPVFHDLAVDKDVLVDIVLLRRASGKRPRAPQSG